MSDPVDERRKRAELEAEESKFIARVAGVGIVALSLGGATWVVHEVKTRLVLRSSVLLFVCLGVVTGLWTVITGIIPSSEEGAPPPPLWWTRGSKAVTVLGGGLGLFLCYWLEYRWVPQ